MAAVGVAVRNEYQMPFAAVDGTWIPPPLRPTPLATLSTIRVADVPTVVAVQEDGVPGAGEVGIGTALVTPCTGLAVVAEVPAAVGTTVLPPPLPDPEHGTQAYGADPLEEHAVWTTAPASLLMLVVSDHATPDTRARIAAIQRARITKTDLRRHRSVPR